MKRLKDSMPVMSVLFVTVNWQWKTAFWCARMMIVSSMRCSLYKKEMKIARVFPRRTKATPHDSLAFVGEPPTLLPKNDPLWEVSEIHVSCTFTFDKSYAEYLAEQWEIFGVPVIIGGPAYDDPGDEFVTGLYLDDPYVITSRGCPNHCFHCDVWRRIIGLQEYPIKNGWILQDDNILACSEKHIRAVFDMLGRQKHGPVLSGGLEAKLLKPWHVELLQKVKPQEMFFAYDTPDDYEPLVEAGKMLNEAGFTLKSRKALSYVLIGYRGDTFEKAEKRLINTLKAGFMPFAMLYVDHEGRTRYGWDDFQRMWARPAIIVSRNVDFFKAG